MKKPLIILPFLSLLVLMIVSFGYRKPLKIKMNNPVLKKGFAVVELFTSEGCSSCPPADEAVAALSKEYASNVFVLGFHVDYWNYLGWKDEFSMAEYSTRQQDYAAVLKLNSVYTPQVIVNGKTEFTGSDKNKLHATVEEELINNDNTAMELSAAANNSKDILVSYKINADNKSLLHIALVQTQAESVVKRGENKGKLLHHIDVVRNFKTVASATGSTRVNIPAGLTAKDCKIIAFVQNKTDLHIISAGECDIK